MKKVLVTIGVLFIAIYVYSQIAIKSTDSDRLGGIAASNYLSTTGTSADSSKLNGQSASYYATAIASDSMKLAGQSASYYATAVSVASIALSTGPINAVTDITADTPTQLRVLTWDTATGTLCISTSTEQGGYIKLW